MLCCILTDSHDSSFESVDLDIHEDRGEDVADDVAAPHAKHQQHPRGASVSSVSGRTPFQPVCLHFLTLCGKYVAYNRDICVPFVADKVR